MWSEKDATCNIGIFFSELCSGNGILAVRNEICK